MRYLILILLLLPAVANATVNEWVLGEPTVAQDNNEWVLGGPFVEVDDTVGGQVINVIMSSMGFLLIIGYRSKKKRAKKR